jgi:hypothetical protein
MARCAHYMASLRKLMPHSFPPMKMLKLMLSYLLVPCFYCIQEHGIVGATLPTREFLVVNVIEWRDKGVIH